MKADVLHRSTRLLRYLLLAGAALYLAVYVGVALARMRYPFELEWMEGGSLLEVGQVLAGRGVYRPPTPEYAPMIYTPLYFYLAAAVARVVGPGFAALRLVSFAASLGCLGLIWLIVRRETASSTLGLLSAGLFAATYRIGGAWLDIARTDSLFLCLLLGALYLIRFHGSLRGYVLAGALIFLAFFTKQTALVIALPLVLYALVARRRAGIALLATVAAALALSTLLMDHLHDGWYSYYVFGLPGQHRLVRGYLIGFWRDDLLATVGLAGAIGLFYFLTQAWGRQWRAALFYLVAGAGMVGESWAARLNYGGYSNALLPAYAMIAIVFGLGLEQVLAHVQMAPDDRRPWLEGYVLAILVVQFAMLVYNPLAQVPTRQDLQAGRELVATIQATPGEVLVPFHGYLSAMAGKSGSAHWMSVVELIGGFGGRKTEAGERLAEEFRQAVRERRFAAIILDEYWGLCQDEIDRHYVRQGPAFQKAEVFWPVTGWRVRPSWVYVPKP